MKELNTIRQWERSGDAGGFARLDARALLLVFLAFVGFVVAAGKYQWEQLLAYFSFPLFFIVAANLSPKSLIKKLLFVSPFIIFLGIFNPFLDRSPFVVIDDWVITGGMISFSVILLKGMLSVLAITILTSLVPFHEVCGAMAALRVPQVLVVQILFLYRYLFVLVEEAQSMQKARDLRSFDGRGKGIAATSKLLGTLFLRTLDRSQRVYRAMVSRGFSGRIPMPAGSRFGLVDTVFVFLSIGFLTGLYLFPF